MSFFLKAILSLCVLPIASVHTLDAAQDQELRSIFRYVSSLGLPGQLSFQEDVIVLQDGTCIHGEIQSLPPLSYGFGTLELHPGTLAVFGRHPQNREKWMAADSQGGRYAAPTSSDRIVYLEGVGERSVQKSLPIDQVECIVLKEREPTLTPSRFQLVFANGDEAPANLVDPAFLVRQGGQEKKIATENLVEFVYHNGLQATVQDAQGRLVDWDLSYIESPTLNVTLSYRKGVFRLPWDHIVHVKKIGFDRLEDANAYSVENPPSCPAPKLLVNGEIEIPDIELIEAIPSRFQTYGEIEIAEVEFIRSPHRFFASLDDDALLDVELKRFSPAATPQEMHGFHPVQLAHWNPGFQADMLIALGEDFDLNGVEESKDGRQEEAHSKNDEEYHFAGLSGIEEGEFPEALDRRSRESKGYIVMADVPILDRQKDLTRPMINGTEGSMVFIRPEGASIPAFWIQRNRITNREYKEFVDAFKHPAPQHWENGEIPKGQEDAPVGNVSYKDAYLYSVWAGKRLPTAEEITVAAAQGAIRMDSEGMTQEWSNTPCQFEETAERALTGHTVVGNAGQLKWSNAQYSPSTGFRLAMFAD